MSALLCVFVLTCLLVALGAWVLRAWHRHSDDAEARVRRYRERL